MIDLVDKIESALTSGNSLWLVIFFIVAFVLNFKHLQPLMDLLELRKKARIKRLIEADQYEHLDEGFRQFVRNELCYEYFLYTTRISVGTKFREKLIEIHQKSAGALPFHHFKRALPHLKYEDDVLSVHLSSWDRFYFFLNWFAAIVLFIIGFLCFVIAVWHRPFELSRAFLFMVVNLVSMTFAFVFLLETRFWFSAKKIHRELEKISGDQSSQTPNP